MSKFLCFNLMFSSNNSILCFSESLLSINLLQVVQLSNPGSSMFLIGSDTKFTAAESYSKSYTKSYLNSTAALLHRKFPV